MAILVGFFLALNTWTSSALATHSAFVRGQKPTLGAILMPCTTWLCMQPLFHFFVERAFTVVILIGPAIHVVIKSFAMHT